MGVGGMAWMRGVEEVERLDQLLLHVGRLGLGGVEGGSVGV